MKKNEKTAVQAGIAMTVLFSAICGLGVYALCTVMNADARKYLVTAKDNNKIIFERLDARGTSFVMDYNLDRYNEFQEYYKYVNVGDTLSCKYTPGGFVVEPFHYTASPRRKVSRIMKINGKPSADVIKYRTAAASRDSVVREIKTKQK